jgi:hypothetical protein
MFALPVLSGVPSDISSYQQSRAHRLFWRRYTQARLYKIWGTLTGRPARLQPLALALQNIAVESRHYAGVQLVALDAIRGSESRSSEFDAAFRPLQRRMVGRWAGVASAWLSGVVFAPVVLIQIGDGYFVRDGHHRISVARATGQRYIDAEVTVWEGRGRADEPQSPPRTGRTALPKPVEGAFVF